MNQEEREILLKQEEVIEATLEQMADIQFRDIDKNRPTPENRLKKDKTAGKIFEILSENPDNVVLIKNTDMTRRPDLNRLFGEIGFLVDITEACGPNEKTEPFTLAVRKHIDPKLKKPTEIIPEEVKIIKY